MKSSVRKVLLDVPSYPFVLKGLRSPLIKEAAVPVNIGEKLLGSFHAIELFEKSCHPSKYPQTIADIVSNTYFRLAYQKDNGDSSTFGTSIVGALSFRDSQDKVYFIPTVHNALVELGEPSRLKIIVQGVHDGVAEISSIRTYSQDAKADCTCMELEISFRALTDICLSKSKRGFDSFRFFTISSMFSNPALYDGNIIRYGTLDNLQSVALSEVSVRGTYLVDSREESAVLQVIKTIGSSGAIYTPGSIDSPSIVARLVSSTVPNQEIVAQGFLDRSTSKHDDSLSSWLEWANRPDTIEKDFEMSIKIHFAAMPPEIIR